MGSIGAAYLRRRTRPLTVRSAAASEEQQIVSILVIAFSSDPAARWMYPDAEEYLLHFPAFVRAFGGAAFAHKSAYIVEGGGGGALWLPPEVHADEESLTSLVQRTAPEQIRDDLFAVLEQMGGYHPTEPHWYLPMIGVDQRLQGQGYGSAMLRYTLAMCDLDHKSAYLESSNPANIPLYQRHGFEMLGTIQVGSSPPVIPMLRTPRQ